ncbi:MAG: DUF2239 family protein [Gemmatimonadaceae bacterium]
MTDILTGSYTAFEGFTRIASGSLAEVALAAKQALNRPATVPVLIYDDGTGRPVDIDPTVSDDELIARLPYSGAVAGIQISSSVSEPRGRGRPKLGVVPREVTLLPRHWDWLNAQPGGASVAIRKLVEDARKTSGHADRQRGAHEAAYRFMSAVAGNLPGFEEATRALFADDDRRFAELVAEWPADVRDYAVMLAFTERNDEAVH